MRGKRHCILRQGDGDRNIPAYAGKTNTENRSVLHTAEHPRVCGENLTCVVYKDNSAGTSPRMRGKRRRWPHELHWCRNIPAYAGKTYGVDGRHENLPEHPRVCGENSLSPNLFHNLIGTSPRMRGKLRGWPPDTQRHRNIPAYAGKTGYAPVISSNIWEHPRVCGENLFRLFLSRILVGTSPRMRGKHFQRKHQGSSPRNIPAYAGKTA